MNQPEYLFTSEDLEMIALFNEDGKSQVFETDDLLELNETFGEEYDSRLYS